MLTIMIVVIVSIFSSISIIYNNGSIRNSVYEGQPMRFWRVICWTVLDIGQRTDFVRQPILWRLCLTSRNCGLRDRSAPSIRSIRRTLSYFIKPLSPSRSFAFSTPLSSWSKSSLVIVIVVMLLRCWSMDRITHTQKIGHSPFGRWVGPT